MATQHIPSHLTSSDLYHLARKAASINSEFSDAQCALDRVATDFIELKNELHGAAAFLHDAEGDSPDGARAEAGCYYKSVCQNLTHEYRDGVNLAAELRAQAERLLEIAKKLDEIKDDLNA